MKGVEGPLIVCQGSRHYQKVKQLVLAALKNHLKCRAYQDVVEGGTEAFRYAHYVRDCPEDVEGAPDSPVVAVKVVELSIIFEKLQMKNLDAAT